MSDEFFHVTNLYKMQQLILFTVVYSYDRNSRLRKNGTASVVIRAYQGGSYAYFNTGVYIEPSHWCKRTKRVKNHPRQVLFNATISKTQRQLEQFEADMVNQTGNCGLHQLKDYKEKRPGNSFIEFFRLEMIKEGNRMETSTYETYEQTFSKLVAYQPNMTFGQLTAGNIRNFLQFLSAQGLHNNSVHKHYKTFKKFVRIALQNGYLIDNRNPCDQVKWKVQKSDPVYLTEDELHQLENYEAPSGKLNWHLAQQCFLFCCYTGLRYSDVSQLTEDNFTETTNGLEMHLTAQKTGKEHRVNISLLFRRSGEDESLPEQIIRQRLDSDDYWMGDRIFPFNHRNTYVRNLKKVIQTLSGSIKTKSVSSHTGRHTFGTIMAKRIDVEVLQRLMQHSFIKETMLYVHLSKKRVNEALKKVEW